MNSSDQRLLLRFLAPLRLTNMIMLEPDIVVFPKALFEKSTTFAQLDPGEALLIIESQHRASLMTWD